MVLAPARTYVTISLSMTCADAFDCRHLDYITKKKGHVYERRSLAADDASASSDVERKVYLLKYFRDYMASKLERDVAWTFCDKRRVSNLDFLVRYYRMKSAIVFKLSNDVLQVRMCIT